LITGRLDSDTRQRAEKLSVAVLEKPFSAERRFDVLLDGEKRDH
jgi:hypothetical protein